MSEISTIFKEDIEYITAQSNSKVNFIIAGMTALMNDIDGKAEMLANEKWYQRMIHTVLGKNSATVNEIKQNYDKINLYTVKAIEELYRRECVDLSLICSVRNQILALMNGQTQLKQRVLELVGALDQKINSIDRYNILKDEVQMGKYSQMQPLIAILIITSQLDSHMLKDHRKMDIFSTIIKEKISINDEKSLDEFLQEILELSEEQLGFLCLGLSDIKVNYIVGIVLDVIERYYFQSDIAKRMTDKKGLVRSILNEKNVNSSVTLSVEDIYDILIEDKRNSFNNKLIYEIEADEYLEKENNKEIIEQKKTISKIKDTVMHLILQICKNSYEKKFINIIDSFCENWINLIDSQESQNVKEQAYYTKILLQQKEYSPTFKDFIDQLTEEIKDKINEITEITFFDDIFANKLRRILNDNLKNSFESIMNESSKKYISIKLEAEKYIDIISRNDIENAVRDFLKGATIIPFIDTLSGDKISKFYGIETENSFLHRYISMLNDWHASITKLADVYDQLYWFDIEYKIGSISAELIEKFVECNLDDNFCFSDYLKRMQYQNKLYESRYN